jgi:hypothetical protein
MVTSFSCHADEAEARARGLDGFRFFQFALAYHYGFGQHTPGRSNIWERYLAVRDSLPDRGGQRGIGTPQQLREHLRAFAEAGVDQVIFIQQGGKNRHDHICEALELFAAQVMPDFKEHEEAREHRKRAMLAPALEQAMQRKQAMPPLADEAIPTVEAYGFGIAQTAEGALDEGTRQRWEQLRRIAEVARRL